MVCDPSSCPAASSDCQSLRWRVRSSDLPRMKKVPGKWRAPSWRAAIARWLGTASSYVRDTAARLPPGQGKPRTGDAAASLIAASLAWRGVPHPARARCQALAAVVIALADLHLFAHAGD